MPYKPHYRVQIGGRFFSTEQWSISCRFTDPTTNIVSTTAAEVALPAIVVASIAYVQTASFAANALLDYVKVNPIGSNGRQIDTNTIMADTSQDSIGGGGPGNMPPQLSVVVTTRTDVQRGRAHAGRWYLPVGANVGGNGRLTTQYCQDRADDAAEWLNALNDAWETVPPIVAAVMSDLGAPGPFNVITAVEVGDVIDTQRRRRNQLRETYVGTELE